MKTIKNKRNFKSNRIACLFLVSIFMILLTGCTRKVSTVDPSVNPSHGKVTEGNINDGKTDDGDTKDTDTNTNLGVVTENNNYKLYFSDKQATYLIAEDRVIDKADAKKVLEELIKGPKSSELSSVMPNKIIVKSIAIKDKIATVDFDDSIVRSVAGTTGESMALFGMANTLILNKQLGISAINLTVNGIPMDSLGGHISLKEPVDANLSLIKK